MLIEELSRRSGVSTRTIRAHQTAGLLPPPRLEGRTGRYGEGHLQRLHAIRRLQARGFSLAAIRELFVAWGAGRSLSEVVGLEPARTTAASSEWFDDLFAAYPETMTGLVAVFEPSLN